MKGPGIREGCVSDTFAIRNNGNIQFMRNSDRLPRFPSMDEVEKADHEQLARWYRFLSFYTPEQKKIVDRMVARFKEMGGMTPFLSKKIGH